MTETHDYERRREIAQWYDDASGWHREINETTPKAVREAMGKLIRCARQMMLRHADEVLAACAEVEQIKADRDSLLRIIEDSFMNLHIPHSAMAFDGRNLTPHAEESARASEIYRTERDAARADLREAMELLAQVDDGQVPHDAWLNARDALLAKHEETQK